MIIVCQIRSVLLWLLIGCLLPLSSTCFSLQSRTQFLQWIGMLSISSGEISEDTTSSAAICNNGALVPEVAVPGAYNQVCMNLPERILKINNSQQVVRIQQQTSGSGKTGLAVWNSGLVLVRLLEALTEQGAIDWKNQRVLELGCGTGLVSIVASRLGSKSVLATDGNPDVVALTRSNVQLNQVQDTVQSEVLQWGLLNAMEYDEAVDIVLGSDLTYNSGTWRVLCETMATVLSPQGFILYLSLGHDGFNVNAEVEGFLSVAREQDLVVVPEIGGMQVSKLLDQLISPSERKLVLQNGVSVVVLQHKRFTKKIRI